MRINKIIGNKTYILSIHRILTQYLLILGFVSLGLKCLLFLLMELTISGGLEHMGIKTWALPLYIFAFLIYSCLFIRYRKIDLTNNSRENWMRTVVLILLGITGFLVAARGVLLWVEPE
jgi:hypothetical protein